MTDEEIIEIISIKILNKYGVSKDKSKQLATDLFHQIIAHGGNPENEKQTDSVIDVVVKSWLSNIQNP